MQVLEAKVREAISFIQELWPKYERPVVYCSFGKDSMVLLWLVHMAGYRPPVLFHKEPFSPLKYAFAHRIIEAYGLRVYDYPPAFTRFSVGPRGDAEVVNFYQCGRKAVYLPTGIKPPVEGEPFLCGLVDLYSKPCGTFDYPWDLGLIGHKDVDTDPVLGRIKLKTRVHHNEDSADFAFPIMDFSDGDIWKFHQVYGVPINERRYDRSNAWREVEDATFNPDYHHACTACMTSQGEVLCPKIGQRVPQATVLMMDQDLPSYVDAEFDPKEALWFK